MPLLIAFGGVLMSIAASLVGRVLLTLGLAFFTYSGFTVGIDWLLNEIKGNFSGMPADVVSFLGWLWVDKAIGMLFSAYSAALALKMVGGTSITKLAHKG